jgi:hypothetical protein
MWILIWSVSDIGYKERSIYGGSYMQVRRYIPWGEVAHLPVRDNFVQAPFLLNIEPVAVSFFVIPIVDHGGLSLFQLRR